MKLGMLIPEFPTQTHVFFWREIEAIRKFGVEVNIISTKRPVESCHHEFAQKATDQTHYIYPPKISHILLLIFRLNGVMRSLKYIFGLSVDFQHKLRAIGYLLCAADLAQFAREMKLDHIHVHSCADAAHIVSMARMLGGVPYSLHLHGDLAVYGVDHAQKAALATFVAAAALPMQRQLTDIVGLPEGRTHTLWMGVDTDVFLPKFTQSSAKPFHLVSVSRLHLCKGHRFTLMAMRVLLDKGVDVEYTIGGSGPHEKEILDDIEKYNLTDKVRLVGSLGETQVRDLLNNADIFILTSYGMGEASPVAVMEAMAAGVPVICSIIGGTPEMIRDGVDGILVPQEDVDAIVKAIQCLHSDPDFRNRLSMGARKRACEQFDCSVTAKKLISRIEDHSNLTSLLSSSR